MKRGQNAVVYAFPDGSWIERWLPQSGTGGGYPVVSFCLKGADGKMLSVIEIYAETEALRAEDLRSQPPGHPALVEDYSDPDEPYEGCSESFKPKWLAFAVDMVLLPGQDLMGKWGVIETPTWVPSQVYERADDLVMETRLDDCNKQMDAANSDDGYDRLLDQRKELARQYFEHVFEGYLLEEEDPEDRLSFHAAAAFVPDANRFSDSYFRVMYTSEWFIYGEHGYVIGRGPTLRAALDSTDFDDLGPLQNEQHEESFYESLPRGKPTVDLDLEGYALLGAASPVIAPDEEFLVWFNGPWR